MASKKISVPEVERISVLISVLKGHVDKRIELQHGFNACIVDPLHLSAWDAEDWSRITPDKEVVDFLFSESRQADRLLRSLQAFVKWQEDANMISEYVTMLN